MSRNSVSIWLRTGKKKKETRFFGFVERLAVFAIRFRNARDYGVNFWGARHFRLPTAVVVNRRRASLVLPEENGIKVAFIEVLLDDCYGLRYFHGTKVCTVIDLGANVGLFSIAARRAFPTATIHAYEPHPETVIKLRANTAALDATVMPEAVGLAEGLVAISEHLESVQHRVDPSAPGSIRQVSLAEALKRIGGACDFLKMDCEGAEWDILSDGESLRNVTRIAIEYHLWAGDYSHEACKKRLEDLGFEVLYWDRTAVDHGLVCAERVFKQT